MRIETAPIEDLIRAADQSRPSRRLRDKALLLLIRHPQVTVEMLASITAAEVAQDAAGGLRFRLVGDGMFRTIYLSTAATAALLPYMESQRLWGSARALFDLSPKGIRSVIDRLVKRTSFRGEQKG